MTSIPHTSHLFDSIKQRSTLQCGVPKSGRVMYLHPIVSWMLTRASAPGTFSLVRDVQQATKDCRQEAESRQASHTVLRASKLPHTLRCRIDSSELIFPLAIRVQSSCSTEQRAITSLLAGLPAYCGQQNDA